MTTFLNLAPLAKVIFIAVLLVAAIMLVALTFRFIQINRGKHNATKREVELLILLNIVVFIFGYFIINGSFVGWLLTL